MIITYSANYIIQIIPTVGTKEHDQTLNVSIYYIIYVDNIHVVVLFVVI